LLVVGPDRKLDDSHLLNIGKPDQTKSQRPLVFVTLNGIGFWVKDPGADKKFALMDGVMPRI
jgi:hypothetical protein